MKLTEYQSSEEQWHNDDENNSPQKISAQNKGHQNNTLARKFIEATDTVEIEQVAELAKAKKSTNIPMEASPVFLADMTKIAIPSFLSYVGHGEAIETRETLRMPAHTAAAEMPLISSQPGSLQQLKHLLQKYALLLIGLLCIIVFRALSIGPAQFLGSQGWAYVLGGPASASNSNILKGIGSQPLQPGTTARPCPGRRSSNASPGRTGRVR